MLGTLTLLLLLFLLLLGVICLFTPRQKPKNTPITEEVNDWKYQKEQARREHEAEQNKEWFLERRWLTDKEIDWACARMEKYTRYFVGDQKSNQMPGSFPGQSAISKFKILPAHQFHYVTEVMKKKEKDWKLAFKELLKEINDSNKELVFIPINQPNFHWSLLVYEGKSKCFWHWDTLQGANDKYVEPLAKELLKQIYSTNELDLNQFLIKKHNIRQNNSYDCGVAVLALIRRNREKYWSDIKNIELGEFDFAKERKRLREEYLQENN